ncbi:MAG: hypothetical protein AAFO01_00155, partial [Pseudomonadota bacterium]
MGGAGIASIALHAVLAVVVIFGMPSFGRPPPAIEETVVVELVSDLDVPTDEPAAPEQAATALRDQEAAKS